MYEIYLHQSCSRVVSACPTPGGGHTGKGRLHDSGHESLPGPITRPSCVAAEGRASGRLPSLRALISSRTGHFQSLGNLLGEEASAVMKANIQGEF